MTVHHCRTAGPRRVLRVRLAGACAASVLVLLGSVACADGPETAGSAARDFAAGFADDDVDRAAAQTDAPDDARAGLAAAWDGLQAESMTASIGAVRTEGATARAEYTYEWTLPQGRVWRYTGTLPLVRTQGDWAVRWTPAAVNPGLGGDQTMSLRTIAAPRAPVIGHDGAPVLEPGISVQVLVSATEAGRALGATASALERLLKPADPSVSAQSIAEQASSLDGNYAITRLTSDEADALRPQLEALPGVALSEQPDLIPTDPLLANDVVGNLESVVRDDVYGTPGWRVVSVNRDGAVVDVLTETAPVPAPAVRVGLDKSVQIAAQTAVGITDKPAVLVAIQPSTGQILAVAQNDAADAKGPIALQGLYPPGSTFKIVTAGAAIEEGLATPQTMLACPGEVTIGTRTIPNYAHFALGTVPMRTAFAASCNTTFAELASRMQADALPDAAAMYGIGVNYGIDGITTLTGRIQPAADIVQRSEDGFGQGRDLVTPFGMALAAATVAHGSTPVPQLISGHPTTVEDAGEPITPEMVDGLRLMMRQVVTSGTGSRIADQGEVYGKTGEAEYEGGSHAWFAGYRGDIAFASLIVGGGSSDNAVAVVREMFLGLPDGYMA
ncbi:penicillin-binding transpeptidase domain-containing protein [Tomitella gaofuii]|uniref:penicillin-binding transpeptidase domain-containing protein n=1 Tax=Tomitella gaofuii TaxID=2760083 RepID=UPI0015FCD135|nr:penicillin-binding transpeptidase domain-containing protein [Tomitella gaofuii]